LQKIKVSDQFKALIINQEGENFTREVKSIDKSFLKHGDVTIKVDYSDLNFKDGMILKNGGRLVKEFPHIPGIDFSGTVIESENSKFKEGDEVILTGFRVGEAFFGGYSQIAKVNADFLVKKPNNLTSKQAMILGTAGFTSLMSAFAIQARETILLGEKVNDVLVTGATGGVGSVAVMALTKLGYNVTAVTGKDSKIDYLKSLGAKTVVNRAEFDKDPRLIDKGLWDGVVDTVGGKILANAIVQTKSNGIIAVCGNANNNELNTSVIPFMLRGIKLWGMDSANCSILRRKFIWEEASKLIDFDLLEKSILTVSLDELLETYPKILKGEISGRVIVDLNK
jgi:alcohol dehydrogenase/acrylyl-CoA reductase (NADPH)